MKLRAALFTLATAVPLLGWWEPDVRLTFNDSASYTSRNSARAMAAGGETLHVVWYDQRDGNREIYYKRSVDRGTTWSSDRRLTSNSAVSRTPSVVVAGADIHVVWYDERDGNREIYHKRSPDRGLTWYADTRLTADTARSYNSSVAAAGDCVHVVWMQDSASVYPDIWYRRSTDRGQTWQPPVRLTDDAERSYNP
ncbi:exo-alpha-sialidase, partial [candidate division WOR-3 bacterium]|nr:exo-alpha-sialidase [candidate division WOR-3 bacterium]